MAKCKVYGEKPEDNEMADIEIGQYLKFAIENIKSSNDWLKTFNGSSQSSLLHADILLVLCRRFPGDNTVSIKTTHVKEWENTFNEWFIRCEEKIPAEYRVKIKETADKIFCELYTHSTDIMWL